RRLRRHPAAYCRAPAALTASSAVHARGTRDATNSRKLRMLRYRFLRTAAVALEFYGILGLAISAAMLVVGITTFGQIAQLQRTAISLGTTRDALGTNRADVQRVGTDLSHLQTQLDAVAASLSQPGVLGLGSEALLPFQVAFYGMCLLVILQSSFSIVAGVVLYRLQRALGAEALFPHVRTDVRTATTIDAAEPDRVRAS